MLILRLICLLLIVSTSIQAQTGFTDRIDLLGGQDFHSGVTMGITDMDGDFRDDIIRVDQTTDVYIAYQNADGSFRSELIHEEEIEDPGYFSADGYWTLCVADVDNNGIGDFMVGGRGLQQVFYGSEEDGEMSFERNDLPGAGFFSQGSNFVDIDNDGWLDAFHCNDDGESYIWSNDQNGTLLGANDWIDMANSSTDEEQNSGNYGSVWTDFDSDGDMDLYIAKCRLGVNNPNDPRRINALFVNDGENNFTEAAADYGLAIGWQSWTAEFQDIDNDGDFDCFVTNHDAPSQLLENDGQGNFTDITSESGIVLDIIPIQAALKDFDNDGFVDLIVTGTNGDYWHNNGDKTFSKIEPVFDGRELESIAVGDINQDGFLDLYGGYAAIYNTPTNVDDALWVNNGGENHFLAISLEGTTCNRSAIGSRLEIYGPFGQQLREVRAGESYGVVHSARQHFGLGQNESIDSLVVTWPNGNTETFENITANQFILIKEGTCVSPNVSISETGSLTICDDESIVLTAESDATEIEWSNGETTQSITISEAGTYSVKASNGDCFSYSASVEVKLSPDETPTIATPGGLELCEGLSTVLVASEAESYSWSNGMTDQMIIVSEAGSYSVTIQGACQEFTSEEVLLVVESAPEIPTLLTADTEIAANEFATLEVEEELVTWYNNEDDEFPIAYGPVFETPVLTENATFYVQQNLADISLIEGGNPDLSGGGGQNPPQFNGELIFDAYEPFVLASISSRTFYAGERVFQIRNEQDEVLSEVAVYVEEGDVTIPLNLPVPMGDNLRMMCEDHPGMYRNDGGINFPYAIGEFGSIYDTNFGDDWYYYFYDWKVQSNEFNCSSERLAVDVSVQSTGISEVLPEGTHISPNPASDHLNLFWNSDEALQSVRLRYIDGRELRYLSNDSPLSNLHLDVSDLPTGIYLLEMSTTDHVFVSKVVIE